jgi:transcriptional regulator with XRE-family HTH domain
MTSDSFRAALETLGWSQKSFADRAGVHVQTVNRWATAYEGAEIPKWVASYLEAMLDLAGLRDKYLTQGKPLKSAPALVFHGQVASDLLNELKAAHVIIRNGLNLMTMEQKYQWGEVNARDGVDGEGVTRANERLAVIAAAEKHTPPLGAV